MNIHVSNISFHTTEETLKEMFSAFGLVKAVKIIRSENPGEKPYGFVEMNSPAEAHEAINRLDGKEIQGRSLRVTIAKGSFGMPKTNSHSKAHPFRNPFSR